MNIASAWPSRTKDECADFFGACLRACDPDIPETADVLEIGCCEYDWLTPAAAAWPQMTFTGIDWRGRKDVGKNPRLTRLIKGDVMAYDFALESFDWVVSISALEHVGLGNYHADPIDKDGDIKAVQRAWSWVKTGGWLYFDVPWNAGEGAYEVVGHSHRIYDNASLDSRLGIASLGADTIRACVASKSDTCTLLDGTIDRLKGGNDFYYIGLWLRKSAHHGRD